MCFLDVLRGFKHLNIWELKMIVICFRAMNFWVLLRAEGNGQLFHQTWWFLSNKVWRFVQTIAIGTEPVS